MAKRRFLQKYSELYLNEVCGNEAMKVQYTLSKVWQFEDAVAEKIRNGVINGGFMFAMCCYRYL